MAKRKDEFVVGYCGEGQVVYGRDEDGRTQWANPLTAKQALRRPKPLASDHPKTIFRLVPVPLSEVEAEARREAQKRKGKT